MLYDIRKKKVAKMRKSEGTMLKTIDKTKVTLVINPHELQASVGSFSLEQTNLAFIKSSL